MSEADTQTRPPRAAVPLTRRTVVIFGIVATVLFSAIFLIVTIYLRQQSLLSVFTAGRPLATQLMTGLLLGIAIATPALFALLKAPFFARLRDFIRDILARLRPTSFDMLLISACAGLGEELFFRATLQPKLGVWLSSLVFALAHTGVSVSRAKLAFALYVFTMGLVLGVLYEQIGLVAAILMHVVYDLIFLLAAKRFLQSRSADLELPM